MIDIKIIADSLNNATGNRLTTFLLTYPRYIHAEVMTHRDFSRNAASSRAIPIAKFREDVKQNPVMPSHWGANQKGMQAEDELDNFSLLYDYTPRAHPVTGAPYPAYKVTARGLAEHLWLDARREMLSYHEQLEKVGLHKQIANRILEPWFHIQLLVSATEFGNFFGLRCHSAAHPDIQTLADGMLYHYMTNPPKRLDPGEWHLPYGDQDFPEDATTSDMVKICTARAARIAYKNFDGVIDWQADMALHDRLAEAGHWSPFEHAAEAMFAPERSGNFVGWKQYRKMFENERQYPGLNQLWEHRKKLGTPAAWGHGMCFDV